MKHSDLWIYGSIALVAIVGFVLKIYNIKFMREIGWRDAISLGVLSLAVCALFLNIRVARMTEATLSLSNALTATELSEKSLPTGLLGGFYAHYSALGVLEEQTNKPSMEMENSIVSDQIEIIKHIHSLPDKTAQYIHSGNRRQFHLDIVENGTRRYINYSYLGVKDLPVKNLINSIIAKKSHASDPDKFYHYWQSRAIAVYLLRGVYNQQLNSQKLKWEDALRPIIFVLNNDPSLMNRKLALDTYQTLTGFERQELFDFEGAVAHWNNGVISSEVKKFIEEKRNMPKDAKTMQDIEDLAKNPTMDEIMLLKK